MKYEIMKSWNNESMKCIYNIWIISLFLKSIGYWAKINRKRKGARLTGEGPSAYGWFRIFRNAHFMGILRVSKPLVNNVYFDWCKWPALDSWNALKIGVLFEQRLEFLLGWVRKDVGEVELCQLCSSECRQREAADRCRSSQHKHNFKNKRKGN